MAADTQRYRAFYETRNSQKFITSDNPDNIRLVRRMAQWLQIARTDRVLDIGSSDGYFLQRLQKGSGFRCGVGIDISGAAVDAARRLIANEPGLRFIVGSADCLPFDAAHFDKIIVNEVIEHVPDAQRVFAEISRVARPGALVFITSPNSFEEMLPVFRPYCRKVDRVEGHLRHFSLKALSGAVQPHGFDVVHVRYEGFLAAWVWYGAIIYNTRVKQFAMRLITKRASTIGSDAMRRPSFNPLAKLPFFIMRAVKWLDAPFERYHRAMGMHVLLKKRQS